MMDQTHIGYTYWQQPEKNAMPEISEIVIKDTAEMGISIEGSEEWWPNSSNPSILPEFDPYLQQVRYIDVFNRGIIPFNFQVKSEKPWIVITPDQGKVEKEMRITVSIDWTKALFEKQKIPIIINGPNGSSVIVDAVVNNPEFPKRDKVNGFIESDGYISIEAEHYSRSIDNPPVWWQHIPDLGRTLSGISPSPVTVTIPKPGGDSPHLEYKLYLFKSGEINVKVFISPTLKFHNTEGLHYGISIDNEKPQIININSDESHQNWQQSVSDNIKILVSKHLIKSPGEHVLKYWMIDPGIVLQKIVIETGDVKPSYLGPPESYYRLGFMD
jgi:hypothetical protein